MTKNSIIDTPWMRNQVENHLIFQYFVKNIPALWLGIVLFFFYILFEVIDSGISELIFSDKIITIIIIPFVIFYLIKMDKFHQACIAWFSVKITLFFTCILLMTVGTISSIKAGGQDAIPNFLLGLTWFPLIEFFPRIDKKQKYITAFRIIFTVIIVIWGVNTGDWYWDGKQLSF